MSVRDKTGQLIEMRDEIEKKPENFTKRTARERLALLFDEGTFVEIGAFVKQRPTEFSNKNAAAEGVVTGYGAVNGALVFAFAQDPAALKGSISEMHSAKIINIVELARKSNAPVVSFIDSIGLRLQEGIDALSGYSKIISKFSEIIGEIPHICVVCGVCAGALSFLPAMADYVVMLKGAECFLSAPSVVAARFKSENKGSAENTYNNGTASVICNNEEEAVSEINRFINTFSGLFENDDDINRQTPEISDILENSEHDVRDIIKVIADKGEFVEFSAGYAKNLVTALINLNGIPVGVVANSPAVKNGSLNAEASKKACKFISFCDDYEIPLLTLVNTNGFEISENDNINECVLITAAYTRAHTAKITLITGRAYGAGYISMCPKEASDLLLAYPTAEVAALPAETGAVFLYENRMENAENPIKEREAIIEEYASTLASPYHAAARGHIDDIIEPATTRQLLISSLGLFVENKEE